MDIKQLTKKCSKCGKIKPLNEFSKDISRKDGKYPYCKQCIAIYQEKNKEKFSNYMEKYRQENEKKIAKQAEIYRQNNKEKIKKRRHKYYIKNTEKESRRAREYYKSHRCIMDEYHNNYKKTKYRTDLKFNLNLRIGSAIWRSLRGSKAGRRWETLVGYTVNDLMKHLKKTMPEGYCWQDFLDGKIHIDHKIPKSAFNYIKPEHVDFRRCWALSNLQLLPAKENFEKSNYLKKPFQPSLAM